MKLADEIRKLLLAAAIASTLAIATGSLLNGTSCVERIASLATHSHSIQVADKGSDGQETHG